MPITLPTDLTRIRPLEGAIVRRVTVGTGGLTEGCLVVNGADGAVKADGAGATYKRVLGIALKAASAGDVCPVVVHGPVGGYTACTVGAAIYPGTGGSVGAPTETASTNKIAVGAAESATTVFVQPIYIP